MHTERTSFQGCVCDALLETPRWLCSVGGRQAIGLYVGLVARLEAHGMAYTSRHNGLTHLTGLTGARQTNVWTREDA